jgi:signal transduction histidine kinase
MLRALPIRWRLTTAFAVVMAVVLAATGAFVHERLASSLDRALDQTLRSRATDVAALAQQSDSGLKDSRPTPGTRTTALAELVDPAGHVLDRTVGLPTAPLLSLRAIAAARTGAVQVADSRLPGGGPVRLLARRVRAQDQTLIVIVGQPLNDRNRALSALRDVLLLGGPVALLLTWIAGYLLAGAALRPVEAMRRRERAFVSDASHELRSPLGMLRTELELVARERPVGESLQSAVGSAIEEADRLGRLADDLLLLARADDHELALHLDTVSAVALLLEAADRARRRSPAGNVQITVDRDVDAHVAADPNLLAQALDNLLANALRHARTAVRLTAGVQPGHVELHVIDDGPGFPADFLPRAWERFARSDPARTADGTGLGLAIVRTIAEAHAGAAQAANTADGGADVWISVRTAGAGPIRSPRSTPRWRIGRLRLG